MNDVDELHTDTNLKQSEKLICCMDVLICKRIFEEGLLSDDQPSEVDWQGLRWAVVTKLDD